MLKVDSESKRLLAANLKRLRSHSQLSQSEIAHAAKMSRRAYQLLESGQGNPTLETLLLIANTYKVDPSRLLSLSHVRISVEIEEFVIHLKRCFENHKHLVGVRTVEGVSFWANAALRKVMGPTQFPVDIKKLADSSGLAIFSAQLTCEKRGICEPYIVPIPERSTGTTRFYRNYPTLLYSKKSNRPHWVLQHAIALSEESYEVRQDFNAHLLHCLMELAD